MVSVIQTSWKKHWWHQTIVLWFDPASIGNISAELYLVTANTHNVRICIYATDLLLCMPYIIHVLKQVFQHVLMHYLRGMTNFKNTLLL